MSKKAKSTQNKNFTQLVKAFTSNEKRKATVKAKKK